MSSGGEKMLKMKFFLFLAAVSIVLLLLGFSASVTSAAFKIPSFLKPYIPAGFVVDEQQCSSRNYGMFSSVGIAARKANVLPKPFKTPEFSQLKLGYVEYADPAYASQAWQESQQKAEKDSKNSTSNPLKHFIGKESIKGGGTIYWYQEVDFNAGGAVGDKSKNDAASQLNIYSATILKRVGNGTLNIEITGFVGDRNLIRRWFK